MKKTLAFILSLTLSFSTITVTAVSAEGNGISTDANPQTAAISSQNNGTVYFSNLNVKTVYKIGEELDLTDGRAYAGGKTADGVNWDIFAQPLESDFFYCDTSEFDNTKAGEYTITVYCKTQPNVKPASFTVTVLDDDSNEEIHEGGTVTVYQKPDKLVYKIGEEFDSTGGKARASGAIEGGAAWDIFAQPLESNYFYCDTSEFDNTTPGEYTITVYCKTQPNVKPASFTVTVLDDDSNEEIHEGGTVTVYQKPDKLVYKIGEEFDSTGGKARASGAIEGGAAWDIFSKPIESNFFYCDTSEFDNTKAGEYTITVYCKTQPNVKPASFTVTVLDDDSNEEIHEGGTVTVYQKPDKLVYKIGEGFDSTGGKARASGAIEGGAAWDIFSKPIESDYFYCDTSEFDNTKAGEYTIYVKCDLYKNVTPDSFTVTVVGDTTTAANVSEKSGDANCDGRVDISDVTLVKCYMLNSEKYGISKQGLLNADVQESGNGINTNDVIMIQQFTLGIIKSFKE